jgi:hypothetical protein
MTLLSKVYSDGGLRHFRRGALTLAWHHAAALLPFDRRMILPSPISLELTRLKLA